MISAEEVKDLSYYTYPRSNWREQIKRTNYISIYNEHQAFLAVDHKTDSISTYLNFRETIENYHAMMKALDDAHLKNKNIIENVYDDRIEEEKEKFRKIAPKSMESDYPSTFEAQQAKFEKEKTKLAGELKDILGTMQQDYERRKLESIKAYLNELNDESKVVAINNYLAQKEVIEAYLLHKDVQAFWENFENRQRTAWALALLYGALQGWGMAGFVLSMIQDSELGAEAEWTIALTIALPVTLVNMWLVRPDLEDYFGFEKYKNLLNGHISTRAKIITAVSSILLGGVVAFGITSSLPTHDTRVIAPVFGLMTAVLSLAEGLLNIGCLDEILKTSFSEKLKQLKKEYNDDQNRDANQRKAAAVFYGVFITSCIGMIGIALVGSKSLSNQLLGDDNPFKMVLACVLLLGAASAQVPFYQDRAARIARSWVPVTGKAKDEIELDHLVFDPRKKVTFAPENKYFDNKFRYQHWSQQALWAANGVFNAPCAYLGVVTTLGKFLGLQKLAGKNDANGVATDFDHQNTFEQIFFQYGNSMEANIIYGIGTLFFVAAVGISMVANSIPPQKMADPKNECNSGKMRAK
ncbi:MAG: hypothetical protein ACHQAX_04705 [Gammaproteobacteria bacterium]